MSSNQQRKSPVPLAGETEPKAGAFVSCRHSANTTSTANNQPRVSVAGHRWHQQATQVACFALSLAAGKSPEAIAAEITARVINNLRSKTQPEGSARP
jgi:hypothetical protein